MSDDPVGVVPERIHGFDGKKGSLESGHSVSGDPDREKLHDRVLAHPIPGSLHGEEPVEHATP
ncbi:MAG: hypothetical protein BWY82_01285 [Verrucomicrobia bacterium ADurb.Bin474]|nr:MAG: hypothetical protein BWY82_01285 [Verrucomicrobia bacterium ADurb.Bin474]